MHIGMHSCTYVVCTWHVYIMHTWMFMLRHSEPHQLATNYRMLDLLILFTYNFCPMLNTLPILPSLLSNFMNRRYKNVATFPTEGVTLDLSYVPQYLHFLGLLLDCLAVLLHCLALLIRLHLWTTEQMPITTMRRTATPMPIEIHKCSRQKKQLNIEALKELVLIASWYYRQDHRFNTNKADLHWPNMSRYAD